MQSKQESVLEEFMQRSFGAQFLYLPKKYRKGAAHREPADLAWVTNEIIVLFYLRSSSEPLDAQIQHNRNQAAGYHRMWATGKPTYALRGKNRFGEECFVPFDNALIYLAVLIVSSKCAPHFSQPLTSKKPNMVLVMPELLIHWVADFGGTIVDLLLLVNIYLEDFSNFDPTSSESFEALRQLTVQYVNECLSKADPERKYLSGDTQLDYLFIFEHLTYMKHSASSGHTVAYKEGKEEISELFGDFMLGKLASIAAGAEKAIHRSEPPTFKKWVVLKLTGYYYSFVIGTVNMGSKNVVEATTAGLKACKSEVGQTENIYIQYGNVLDANEYRTPLWFGIPKELPRKHAAILVEQLLNKSNFLE